MGPAISKSFSATDILNESISNVIMNSASECASNTNISQNMTIDGLTNYGCPLDLSQEINLNANFSCMQSNDMSSELQTKLANQLDEKLSAALSGLNLGVFSKAEAESIVNIKNNILVNVDMNAISKCVANTLINQNMAIKNLTLDCSTAEKLQSFQNTGIKQVIAANLVTKCIQANSQLAAALTELETAIAKKQEAESAGSELFPTKYIVYGLIFFAIFALIVVAIIVGFNPITWIIRAFSGSS